MTWAADITVTMVEVWVECDKLNCLSYQGQSSKLGVGSQEEVLYCTVLHHMAPGQKHDAMPRIVKKL